MNLLHLSDIHFRRDESGGTYDLDVDLRNELERDIARLLPTLGPITGILVTGDIAFAGLKEEYDIATEWLDRLCDICHCGREAVWTVPGNHDVERRIIEESETLRTVHEKLRGTSEIDEQISAFMRDRTAQRMLYEPIIQYNLFAARYGCVVDAANPFWEDDLTLNDGSVIRMRGLNTTLISSRSDDSPGNKLVLGTIQSKPPTMEGVTYMSLGHHPPQWLRDEDVVSNNLQTRVHVQLFGHKHKQTILGIENSVRIIAGAVHPNRREPAWHPRYNFILPEVETIDNVRKLKLVVHPRIWSEEENVFRADYDSQAADKREYLLNLAPWNAGEFSPKDVVGRETNKGAGGSEAQSKGTDLIGTQGIGMNKSRRLTYRFYSLPYDSRIQIARQLELTRTDDEGLQGNELFNQFLLRAKTENKLRQLWDEVQKAHADDLYSDNPYETDASG